MLAGEWLPQVPELGTGTLYALAKVDNSKGDALLVGINPATGEASSMGIVVAADELACSPAGRLVTARDSFFGYNLGVLDPVSLLHQYIEDTGAAGRLGGVAMAFSPRGVLFLAKGDRLETWLLSPATRLTSTYLKMLNRTVDIWGDLAVSPEGRVFGLSQTYFPRTLNLVWIEPLTGAVEYIGPTGLGNIQGLAFAPGGQLLGVASDNPSSGRASLVQIDTATGTATEIARITGIPEVLSITGLCSFQIAAQSP